MQKCALCGAEFTAQRAGVLYCSKECLKKSWTARRSAARALRRRTATRVCEFCGKPFEWTSLCTIKRFCSSACKRRAESAARAVDRTRADVVMVKAAHQLPRELDALREAKGDEYFAALFKLPEAEQYAEMSAWDESVHAAALVYMNAAADLIGEREEEIDIEMPETPPMPFDEENHFGD